MSARYLTATRRPQPCLGSLMRAAMGLVAIVTTLVFAGSAMADGRFYIRGGGFGHGIGMSQYGTYGYALHGKGYRWILAHYYRHITLGKASPNRTVRVLVGTHSAAFAGATRVGNEKIDPGTTYP